LITFITVICTWIWSLILCFSYGYDNFEAYWTWKWLFYCGLQTGQGLSILMLIHIACKPPTMREHHGDNGNNGGTTTVIIETQQQYQPPQPQYQQQQPYP
jgi:hypothetical protein